jgi:hypothetical protein
MPFVKGKSGNPHGRPKSGQSFTDLLKHEINIRDQIVENSDGSEMVITRKQAVNKKLIDLAIAGDLGAIKYIYDRIDGTPISTTNIISDELPQIVIFQRPPDEP